MDRRFVAIGAISAFLAVAAGAFGAHALRDTVPPDRLAVWETAARYQMYHALGLLVVAYLTAQKEAAPARLAGWLFVAGTVLFSGSLYLLTVTGITWLGAITPLGGLAFLAGWLLLAWTALRRQGSPPSTSHPQL
jgi:uncharacterized membrane protein YgdD (TMEM256/DUF423 family)